jgi:hypothetical protein
MNHDKPVWNRTVGALAMPLACCLLVMFGAVLSACSSGQTAASATNSSTTDAERADPSTVAIGAYAGPANVAGVHQFALTTGANVAIASDYLPADSGWATMTTATNLDGWLLSHWNTSGFRLALGVPMIPEDGMGNALTTLTLGASGADNPYFVTLAQTLVEAGEGNAILRIGWEFDGTGYPWSVATMADARDYAAYWRQIVTAMRSIQGANFTFDWNPDVSAFLSSASSNLAEAAFPGNSYVSEIGGDFYDQSWNAFCRLSFNNTSTPRQSNCVWNRDSLPALNRMAIFAKKNALPLTFPEWGVASLVSGHGLGDDPTFVRHFTAWVATHRVAWISYFDYNPDGNQFAISGNLFPRSLTALKLALGAPGFVSSR